VTFLRDETHILEGPPRARGDGRLDLSRRMDASLGPRGPSGTPRPEAVERAALGVSWCWVACPTGSLAAELPLALTDRAAAPGAPPRVELGEVTPSGISPALATAGARPTRGGAG